MCFLLPLKGDECGQGLSLYASLYTHTETHKVLVFVPNLGEKKKAREKDRDDFCLWLRCVCFVIPDLSTETFSVEITFMVNVVLVFAAHFQPIRKLLL